MLARPKFAFPPDEIAAALAMFHNQGEGQEERVKTLEAEIDDLLCEKEEVEKWATVGSA